ncbi:MAG: hypothetical protein HY722_02145 [Planctomycetes bacterium]|nr:hypothetical protein [Planctomycetota bacterium]
MPRRAAHPVGLAALLVLGVALPAAILAALGWRSLESERVRAQARSRAAARALEGRASEAAWALAAEVEAALAGLASEADLGRPERLASLAARAGELPLVGRPFVVGADGGALVPRLGPEGPPPPEPPRGEVARLLDALAWPEDLEYVRQDPAAAAQAYRELLEDFPGGSPRAVLLHAAGSAEMRAGRFEAAAEAFREVVERHGRDLDLAGTPLAAYALLRLAEARRAALDAAGGVAVLEDLLDRLARGSFGMADYQREALQRAAQEALATGDPEALARARAGAEFVEFLRAHVLPEVRGAGPGAGRLARRVAGRPRYVAWARGPAGEVVGAQVDLEEVRGRLEGRLVLASREGAGAVGLVEGDEGAAVLPAGPFAFWGLRAEAPDESEALAGRERALGLVLAASLAAVAAALVATFLAVRRAVADARSQAEFVDTVAHELRSPVAAVRLMADILCEDPVEAAKAADYHRRMAREAERLGRLVDHVLEASRAERGSLRHRSEAVDLAALARQAVEGLGPAEEGGAASRAPAPVSLVAAAPAPVRGDPEALRRVVDNLLGNALKYGMGYPVELTVSARGAWACLEVEDRGVGIAAEHAGRIFERFYRVPSATHEFKGVGLGLWLSRRIARDHGGELELARSVPGQGSTFRLRLPVGST